MATNSIPQIPPATLIQAILQVEKGLPQWSVIEQVFPDFATKFEKVNGTTGLSIIRIGIKSSTVDGVKATGDLSHYYISLRDFCRIVNSTLLIDQNNNPIVKIHTGTTPTSKYRTFDYHTSADPGVCIIPNTNGWPITDFAKNTVNSYVQGDPTEILNIFVNFNLIESHMKGLVASSKEQRTVYNLFDPIFAALNDAMGGINQLGFHYEESEQTFYIVDRQVQVEKKEEIPILNITGLKSTVTQFDFTTKLSPAIATMVAVSAQASGEDVGLEAEALFKWNEGLTDRITTKRKQNVTSTGTTAADKEASKKEALKQQQGRVKSITQSLNTVWKDKVYNSDDIKNAVVQYQAYAAYYLQSYTNKGNTAGPAGIIPFEVGIEMDGISGIKIGQAFRINKGIMPNKYYDVIGFLVTGVEHSITNNRWVTKLKAQTIVLEGAASKTIAPDQTVNPITGESNEEGEGLDPVPENYESVTDTQLFTYLSWQQGLGGAAEHYSLYKQNGKRKKYSIPVKNIQQNWPGKRVSKNGVTKAQIANYYSSDQPTLAAAFVDVWRQAYYSKLTSGLKMLNSNKTNRSGVPYADIKKAFENNAKPSQGLTFNNLAAFGFIENGYNTDTAASGTFQSMFQMNKKYENFAAVLTATNLGQGHAKNWTEYGPVDKFVALAAPEIISNFNAFKKYAGFVG
jgi:hypothetical protein